jgi:acyl-CoA thioesterase I
VKRLLLLLLLAVVLGGAFRLFRSPAVRITNAHPVREAVVCFGDSLTYGTGAGQGMDYPSHLALLLGLEVINAGRPGETTAGALRRLGEDVLAYEPGIVFLTLGGNDLKNGIDREQAFANLREIILAVQKDGAMVVVGGIDVPFYGRGFGDAYRDLAEETGAVLVPNVYEGIWGRSEFMNDPIHPNAEGYRVMAERFYRAAAPYL